MAETGDDSPYPLELVPDSGGWIIETRPLFEALIRDIQGGVAAGLISRRFHGGLTRILSRVAVLVRERTKLDRICLSGGSFQNVTLLERLVARLDDEGFEVYTHSEVPAGDGGLSLGQALVAAHRLG